MSNKIWKTYSILIKIKNIALNKTSYIKKIQLL